MPHTITHDGTTLSSTLSVPSDGIDPVDEASVDPIFQNLLNNDFYITTAFARYKPRIQAFSTNGTAVRVGAFFGLWIATVNVAPTVANWITITNQFSPSITAANLDTGVSFTPSTAYYVYARNGGSGIASFECSLVAPDITLNFKGTTPDITRRYICSFLVNGAGSIIPFNMVDYNYDIQQPPFFSTGNTTVNASATITLVGFPTTMASAKLVIDFEASGAAGDVSISVYASGAAQFKKTIYAHNDVATSRRFTTCVETTTSNNTFLLDSATTGANCIYTAYVNGYRE